MGSKRAHLTDVEAQHPVAARQIVGKREVSVCDETSAEPRRVAADVPRPIAVAGRVRPPERSPVLTEARAEVAQAQLAVRRGAPIAPSWARATDGGRLCAEEAGEDVHQVAVGGPLRARQTIGAVLGAQLCQWGARLGR